MSQNLSPAAVAIGVLRVKTQQTNKMHNYPATVRLSFQHAQNEWIFF